MDTGFYSTPTDLFMKGSFRTIKGKGMGYSSSIMFSCTRETGLMMSYMARVKSGIVPLLTKRKSNWLPKAITHQTSATKHSTSQCSSNGFPTVASSSIIASTARAPCTSKAGKSSSAFSRTEKPKDRAHSIGTSFVYSRKNG